jgi:hypothetical protein
LTSAADGVSAGIRPSGGSVMIEVRRVFTTRAPYSRYTVL